MIREGTAARNLRALAGLLVPQYYEHCMFCTDDKHPNDLLHVGHMDAIIREAVQKYKVDPIIAIKAAPIIRPDIFIWRAEVRLCRDIRRILLCLTIFRICMWR